MEDRVYYTFLVEYSLLQQKRQAVTCCIYNVYPLSSKGMLIEEKHDFKYCLIYPDRLVLLISVGLEGGTGGATPWVRSECSTPSGRREVRGQTCTPAQSHPANFTPKCPRCRTSRQVA